MKQSEAKVQARTWWGENGSTEIRGFKVPHRYVVGTSTLSSRLGGHVSTVYGASWRSFEEAFQNAIMSGHIPGTGFENDDSLEFEA